MKTILSFFLLISLLGSVAATPAQATSEAEAKGPKKRVLLLNSYQNGYAWSDDILNGVRQQFKDSGVEADLFIEYMDTKRYTMNSIEDLLIGYLRHKYARTHFDVIIASDNNAYVFLLRHRDALFPNSPVVFCGINDFKPQSLESAQNFTGIVESPNIGDNLRLGMDLNPEARRVVVISDESVTSKAITNQVRVHEDRLSGRLSFEYWDSLPLAELLNRVETLGPETMLFLTPFYKGAHGELFSVEEVLSAVRDHADVMIFSSWRFLLGYGIVGGKLLSGQDMGRAAAGMAERIMGGVPAENIPVLWQLDTPYAFDYDMLQRFGIDENALPEDSEIINQPDAFYRIDPKLFWTILGSLVVLSIILVLLVLNVLKRRTVEHEIKAQLRFRELLMDTIPLLVCWKDRTQRYLGANKSFTDFFNVLGGPAKILGERDEEIMENSAVVAQLAAWDRKVVKSGKPLLGQTLGLPGPDGSSLWLDVNKVPLHGSRGQLVGTLSTAEDMTRKVNLERQLLQSQKMEAIGTLAGGIAHDFNNILTTIINSTELALSDVDEGTMTHKDLSRALTAADRGSRVVKQILTFSRPSKEGFTFTDVADTVRESVELIKASLPRNIEVRTRMDAPETRIWGNPTQLHQVVMNLCTNSFQALRETGGELELSLGHTTIEDEKAEMLRVKPGPFLRLSVSDNGPGIDLNIAHKIFDPFFTTKGKTEGTGLGLAVVHGIIQGHNGGIHVSSIPWERTSINIYLPCDACGQLEDVAALVNTQPGKERILFVEDDPDQLDTVPRLLEQLGYTVLPMNSPTEAIETLRQNLGGFDLVITDYDMPGTNGLELARKVAYIDPGLPVLMVSGRRGAAELAETEPSIRRVVMKPYNQASLSKAIRTTLDKNGH